MSSLPVRLLLHPSDCFSAARHSRAGWVVSFVGYYCLASSEAVRTYGHDRGFFPLLLWSAVAFAIAIITLAVLVAFLGARLFRGTASLALTVLVIGWAAFWPGIAMWFPFLAHQVLRAISVEVARFASIPLALLSPACWVWYIVLSVKAIRAINGFTTGRAVQVAILIFVLLFLVVLVQYFATIRPPDHPVK